MKAIVQGARWEMNKAAELLELLQSSSILLACGVATAAVYVAANVVVPMLDPNYHWMSQTVSELSAIGAPAREVWVWMMLPFGLLLMAFGIGVYLHAQREMRNAEFDASLPHRRTRIVGALLVAQAVISYFWPPMNMRGAEMTLTDTLHIAWTFVVVPIMMLSIWFSRDLVGRRFAYLSIAIMFGFGLLTGLDGPNIAANLPTPYVGVWERINIATWVVWLVVLSVVLLRARGDERGQV